MSMKSGHFFPLGLLIPALVAWLPAEAATRLVYSQLNPASTCQLSIPTTDTEARPKATGFRNESTSKSVFVICGYPRPTNDGFPTTLEVTFTSIDGVARNISCTAVTGLADLFAMVYSSKSISSTAYGTYGFLNWVPADFSGSGSIPNGFSPSVTCTLPPQTAIALLSIQYPIEIGS